MAQDVKELKFETWKHGLLDVSKRNKMINYRKTKRATLKILSPDFCALFDRLVHREESIPFKVRVDCSHDTQVTQLFYLMEKVGCPVEITKGEIETDLSVDDSNRTLKQLRSKSKLSLEEQGINILYLSFGFLEWKQKPTEKAMLAPLVLVPVGLTMEAYGSPYVLNKLDEDIVVNPTLSYVLSSDFGIVLPEFDPVKSDIGDYMSKVRGLATPLGWHVLPEVNLGLLSFLKIVMYRDLEKYRERIFENPIINAFCGDTSLLPQWTPDLVGHNYDRENALDTYQVVNADSSQQDAIMLSKKGYSFVLQGPPGTGKSQTITNIIAEGLADGKKILFVSEKMAALSVVYHRLEEVNLSEYCLSLHNYKADKKKVIAELADSLDAPRQVLKQGVMDFAADYERQREELNGYFAAIKKERQPLGRSLYDVMTELSMLENVPIFSITESVLEITGADYKEKLASLRQYKNFLDHYTGDIKKNPWKDTHIRLVTFDLRKSVEQTISEMSPVMMGICSTLDYMQDEYGVGRDWKWKDYSEFIQKIAYAKILEKFSGKAKGYYAKIFAELPSCDVVLDFLARFEARQGILVEKGYSVSELVTEEQCQIELDRLRERSEIVNAVYSFMDEYNRCFQTNAGYDYNSFQKQLLFLQLALSCMNFDASWLEDSHYESAKTNLSLMKTLQNKVYDADRSVQKLLGTSITAFSGKNISLLKQRYDSQKEKISSLEQSWSRACLGLSECGLKMETLTQAKETRDQLIRETENLEKVKVFVDNVNCEIHMEYRTERDALERIHLISKMLMIPYNYRLAWVTDGNFNSVKQMAEEMSSLSGRIKTLSAQLLSDWEDEFLSFECNEIYNRFKVEYTSFFKRLGGQYKSDKRTLMAMKKNVEKKLEDSVCLADMDTLREYQKVKKQYDDKSAEASSIFAEFFHGIDTDWAWINDVLGKCGVINSYYEKYGFTVELLSLLGSSYDVRRYKKINGYWPDELISGGLLQEYRGYIEQHRDENLADVISDKRKQITVIDVMLMAWDSIRNYLDTQTSGRNNEESEFLSDHAQLSEPDLFFDDMKALEECLIQYYEGLEKTKSIFPRQYKGENTEWDYIEECMKKADPLIRYAKEVPLTAVQVSFMEKSVADRAAWQICGISLRDWMKKESVDRLVSAWNDSEKGVDRQAQEYTDAIHAVEDFNGILSKIATFFCNLSDFQDVREMLPVLRNYVQVIGLLEEQQNEAANWFATIGFSDFRGKSQTIFELFEEYIEPLAETVDQAFALFDGDRVSCEKAFKGACEKSRFKIPEEEVLRKFASLFNGDMLSEVSLHEMSERSQRCSDFEELNNWILFCSNCQDCVRQGLESYLDYIEDNHIENSRILSVYRKSFLTRWMLEWLNCDELKNIRLFQSYTHEELIRGFRVNDHKLLKANQARLNAKLSSEKPSGYSLSLNGKDEISILRRENEKKRKVMPLRRLFKEIPMLLQKLKPCFMMSPLSVSYFLDSDVYDFDMVIFDEASQILPEDAVGAIYRGRQVIIAGDTKQMPPTNFFTASAKNDDRYDSDADEDNEEYYDVVSESVLDEANTCLPGCTLLWHYRSKDESLIAFSNREIYGNRLTTFPNCRNESDKGLEYIYVSNGYYEGGGRNCNVEEAKRCVELVEEHLKIHPDRSLGIIAFSEKQQNVIDNAVQEWRLKNPTYEGFFDEDREEPFFVKNLESVQGDERDTIIFSVCYARNKDGKMYMRFGPLGQAGGERRLNVAITRAKYNVKLVGSILPNDILLKETSAEGVRMLHDYIFYAMQNDYGLPMGKDGRDDPDQFPEIIGEFIMENGYRIRRNIGESQYKVDIAVLHPSLPDTYVAGIECDGENYSSARTARDRDFLRKNIMESMGWHIYHVWSLAWYKNPKNEKKRLLDFLEETVNKYVAENPEKLPKPRTQPIDTDLYEDISLLTNQEETVSETRKLEFERYTVCNPWKAEYVRGADNYTNLENRIMYVIEHEQPIHIELLYKRLATIFGRQKATEPVRRTVDDCIRKRLTDKISIKNSFIYLKGAGEIKARAQNGDERSIEYICPEEICDAMKSVVEFAYGIEREALFVETARVFGFTRRGARITDILTNNFEGLVRAGMLKLSDGKVYLGGGAMK